MAGVAAILHQAGFSGEDQSNGGQALMIRAEHRCRRTVRRGKNMKKKEVARSKGRFSIIGAAGDG